MSRRDSVEELSRRKALPIFLNGHVPSILIVMSNSFSAHPNPVVPPLSAETFGSIQAVSQSWHDAPYAPNQRRTSERKERNRDCPGASIKKHHATKGAISELQQTLHSCRLQNGNVIDLILGNVKL